MAPAEAAKLLELPVTVTPEQAEARFHELRAKLEDRIAKAPTPGLKVKYRESLDEITQAFEALTLAADASALPVLKQQTTEDGGPRTAGAAATPPREPAAANPKSTIQNRKSGTEFLIVAVIAVAVLGTGGWFVMKTSAENAEKARLAAEAKAEAEQGAARVAEAAATEARRQESARALVRGRLAELNVRLEAVYANEPRIAASLQTIRADLESERRVAPGEPSVRSLVLQARAAALEKQLDALRGLFSDHPARVARRRAETMLEASSLTDAEGALTEFAAHIESLERAMAAAGPDLADLDRRTAEAARVLIQWRQRAAGDEMARHIVRVFGQNPDGIPADEAAAVAWLRQAARRGDMAAMHQVGLLQIAGRLPDPPDPFYATGDRWIRQAADLGLPEANVWMGRFLKNSLLSVPHFKRAAEAGHADGEYEYGLAVLTGWGMPADPATAARWLERAARQGHASAQYLLGRLYEQGRGVPANASTAYDWLRQAARQGEAEAQAHLRSQRRDW